MTVEDGNQAPSRVVIAGFGACGADVVRLIAKLDPQENTELCTIGGPDVLERATGTQRFRAVELQPQAPRLGSRRPHAVEVAVPGVQALAEKLSGSDVAVLVMDLTDPSWLEAVPQPGALVRAGQAVGAQEALSMLLSGADVKLPQVVIGMGLVDDRGGPPALRETLARASSMWFFKKSWQTGHEVPQQDGRRRNDAVNLVRALVDPMHDDGNVRFELPEMKLYAETSGHSQFASTFATGEGRDYLVAQELIVMGAANQAAPLAKARRVYLHMRGGKDVALREVHNLALVVGNSIEVEPEMFFTSMFVDGENELTATVVWA
ncbi:MAG: hypothetical protein ABIJ09_25815 [Pseudomonadota bacterium]